MASSIRPNQKKIHLTANSGKSQNALAKQHGINGLDLALYVDDLLEEKLATDDPLDELATTESDPLLRSLNLENLMFNTNRREGKSIY